MSTSYMMHPYALAARAAHVTRLARLGGFLMLLAWLLPGTAGAQAPMWAGATSGNNFQPPTGGTSTTRAVATDPATGNVYATGYFTGTITFGSTRLVSVGSNDVFVAKWDATAGAWTSAMSGGGTSADFGYGVAVASAGGVTSVYVTGYYNTSATIAGTALTAAGGTQDLFVAKYTDPGTGLATTTGGAVSGGGSGTDLGQGVAIAGQQVYVGGYITPSATFGSTTLANPAGSQTNVLARVTDVSLTPPVPTITSFTPLSGPVGTPVTITGTNLGSASSVSFNGTAQTTFTSNSSTQIVLNVPAGATTGTLTVTTAGGTSAASSQTFTVTTPPTLAAVAPTPGGLGQRINLTGTNLSSPTALTINGANALGNIISNSGTSLVVRVPVTAAASGNVVLTTANGTATAPFAVMAPPGNALAFDGVDDELNTAATAPAFGSGSLTLEAWVRTNDATPGGVFVAVGCVGGNNDYWLGMNNRRAAVSISGGAAVGTSLINDGRWHHLAGVRNGLQLTIYVDGVAQNTVTNANAASPAAPLSIGSFGGSYFWPGSLDKVRLWNRAQVPTLASRTAPALGTEPGLVLYYNFDQGTPATASTGDNAAYTTLYDLSPNATPATLTNFALASGNTTSNYVQSYALVVPVLTTSTARSATGFTVNWLAPALGTATSYLLDVSTTPDFASPIAGSPFATTATSYTLTGLNPSSAYFYRVRALNSALATPDQGAFSNTVSQATPLPVELTAFTATPEGRAAVRLAWATASEKDSQAFAVERSADGRTFALLGTVAAAGSSSSARTYELLDGKLPADATQLYYRLKQVDNDGSFSYSPVRVVALKGAAEGLALYPNPATTRATLTGALPGTTVTVFDALGRAVISAPADASGMATLALPTGLPAGVYVVRAGSKALRLTVE